MKTIHHKGMSQQKPDIKERMVGAEEAKARLQRALEINDAYGGHALDEDGAVEFRYSRLKDANGKVREVDLEEFVERIISRQIDLAFSREIAFLEKYDLAAVWLLGGRLDVFVPSWLLGAAIETGTVERVKARLEQLCEQFEGTLFKRIEETKVVFPISAKGYIEFLGELEKIGVKRDKVAFLHRLIETFQSTIVTLIKSRQGKREDEVEKANQLVGSICDALIHLSSEMGDSQGAFKSALDSIQAEAVKAEQDRVIELKDKISPIYVTELKDKISPIHVRAQRFQEEVHRYWPRATPPEPRAHASELLQLSVECKNDEKDMKVISTELEMLRGHLNGLSRLGIIRSDSVTFSDLNDLERVVERINGLNEHSEDILTMHKQHFSIYFNAVDENN